MSCHFSKRMNLDSWDVVTGVGGFPGPGYHGVPVPNLPSANRGPFIQFCLKRRGQKADGRMPVLAGLATGWTQQSPAPLQFQPCPALNSPLLSPPRAEVAEHSLVQDNSHSPHSRWALEHGWCRETEPWMLLFSRQVIPNYLQHHGLLHARLFCPSPSPGALDVNLL